MAKADVLKRLLTGPFAHCGIRWGLTGTVPKADYEFMGLKCSIGEVANRIQASELQDKGVLANCHVNVIQTQDHPQFKTYSEELKWLTTDITRMTWVANTIKDIATSGNTLILVDRISAGELLEKKFLVQCLYQDQLKIWKERSNTMKYLLQQIKLLLPHMELPLLALIFLGFLILFS